MSLVQIQEKLKRTEHDVGHPCKTTIRLSRQVMIGAYGTFAEITVNFDADADAAINRHRCEQLQNQLADIGKAISEAAERPQG